MNRDSTFVIETREHLIGMLAEAAEVEHHLMCCYLYAAFSLKQDAEEGLSDVELAAVHRWRGQIMHVAIDEMQHLALVANLCSAIGGAPHFGRQNFPVPPGAHPAGIVVKLAPFNYETLRHFIFLERPDGAAIADGSGFEPSRLYVRGAAAGRLMPNSQDYETVGDLYRIIRAGFERLASQYGEAALFIGNPLHQLGHDLVNMPGLTRVKCLKTTIAALDGIVQQGEGAPGYSETSHYQRFIDIQKEFEQLRAANPQFTPARPAAHNPVMRRPTSPEDRVWINASPAAELIDLANAAYTQMLRLLMQAYAECRGTEAQRPLVEAAIALMFTISPIASELTRLQANDGNLNCTAGMSFAMLRDSSALPAGPSTDFILTERLREIANTASSLPLSPQLSGVAAQLQQISRQLQTGLAAATNTQSSAHTESTAAARPTAAPTLSAATVPSADIESVEGKTLTLHFEARRCIHARHCVLGQPAVFKANVQGPWLDPDAATVEALVTVAIMCPSGAIQYTRKDGVPEPIPLVNLVQLRENGPLGLRGDLRLNGESIGYRATLCRCGASKRKPFCDGSHHEVHFIATAEPDTHESQPLVTRDGPVDIQPQRNGPYQVRGNLEICAGTGRTVDRVTATFLCRCGQSANKPFCDGSHARVGFLAD